MKNHYVDMPARNRYLIIYFIYLFIILIISKQVRVDTFSASYFLSNLQARKTWRFLERSCLVIVFKRSKKVIAFLL